MSKIKKKWKTIDYYGLNYNISNYGDVISEKTGHMVTERLNRDGYPTVTLGYYKNRTSRTIHSLVADNFIDKPKDYETVKYEINHIDFDRENYMEDNLEWITHYKNIMYSRNAGNYDHINYFGENNPNYGNDTLKKKYANNPELAKMNNSRKGKQNGRCVPIKMFKDGKLIKRFDYKRECSNYLIKNGFTKSKNINSVSDRITSAIKENKDYKGFTFQLC